MGHAARFARGTARLLLWTLLAVALLVALALFAITRPAALQWAAEHASGWTGGRLTIERVEGSLIEPLQIGRLHWRSDGTSAELRGLHLDYAPRQLLDRRLHVRRLTADEVVIDLPPPTAGADPSAPVLPARLPLPLAIDVDEFRVGRLVVRRDATELARIEPLQARLATTTDHVTLDGLHADVRIGQGGERGASPFQVGLDGRVTTAIARPFDTALALQIRLSVEPEPLTIDVAGHGPLTALDVVATSQWIGASARVHTIVDAGDVQPVHRIEAAVNGLDLARYRDGLPTSRLGLTLDADLMQGQVLLQGPLAVTNAVPGPLDERKIPVATINAMLNVTDTAQELRSLVITGPAGRMTGSARHAADGLHARLAAPALALRGLQTTLPDRIFDVEANVDPAPSKQGIGVALKMQASSDDGRLDLAATYADDLVTLRDTKVVVRAGPDMRRGEASLSGTVQAVAPHAIRLDGRLTEFDPGHWVAAPPMTLNGTVHVGGTIGSSVAPGAIDLQAMIDPGRFDGRDVSAQVRGRLALVDQAPGRVSDVHARVRYADADVTVSGALGQAGDALDWAVTAPRLANVVDGAAGSVNAQGRIGGELMHPSITAQADLQSFALAGTSVRQGRVDVNVARLDVAHDAPFTLTGRFGGVKVAGSAAPAAAAGSTAAGPVRSTKSADASIVDLETATMDLRGSMRRHALDVRGTGRDQALRLSARGGIDAGAVWTGRVDTVELDHPALRMPASPKGPVLQLKAPFDVVASAAQVSARPARFMFAGAPLDIERLDWRDPELKLTVRAAHLPVVWAERFVDGRRLFGADVRNRPDLLLGALVSFEGRPAETDAKHWNVKAAIERESGDLRVLNPGRAGASNAASTANASAAPAAEPRSRRPTVIAAGLRALSIKAALERGVGHVDLLLDGERTGRVDAKLGTQLGGAAGQPMWSDTSLRASPLRGRLAVDIPSFRWLSAAVPETWRVEGAMKANVDVGGTLADPRPVGTITASGLRATELTTGLRLRQGELQARINGRVLDIDRFRLRSGDGTVEMTGRVQPPADGPTDARVVLDHLMLPVGQKRRIVLSGQADVGWLGNEARLKGRLVADEGSIDIENDEAPSLGSDVHVIGPDGSLRPASEVIDAMADGNGTANADESGNRSGSGSRSRSGSGKSEASRDDSGDAGPAGPKSRGSGSAAAPAEPALRIISDLDFDLGKKFRLYGLGLDARLEGTINIGGELPDRPVAKGIVNIVDGRYLIYGRRLEVRRGQVIFDGPLADPALDIVAIRPFLTVEPGVEITGTASMPKVTLTSKTEMSDPERLSWLILGTGLDEAQGAGQMLVLQAAADQMFGSKDSKYKEGFTDRLGIDSFGVKNTDGSSSTSGPVNQGTVVSVGKRLSSRLFVTYEQSLRGTYNVVKLTYSITDRLSLSLQAGTDSAADILYYWLFR